MKAGEGNILRTVFILSGERDYRGPGRFCDEDMV